MHMIDCETGPAHHSKGLSNLGNSLKAKYSVHRKWNAHYTLKRNLGADQYWGNVFIVIDVHQKMYTHKNLNWSDILYMQLISMMGWILFF